MTAVCMPALVNQNSTKSGSEVYELEEFCLVFLVSNMLESPFKTALVKCSLIFLNQHLSNLKPKTQDPEPKLKTPNPKPKPKTQNPNSKPITQNPKTKTHGL